MSSEQRHLEIFVLSYRPNVLTNETFDVGLLAMERNGENISFSGSRFTPDIAALKTFDQNADIEHLRATLRDIEVAFRDPRTAAPFLKEMLDSFVTPLTLSSREPVAFFGDPVNEIDRLAGRYFVAWRT